MSGVSTTTRNQASVKHAKTLRRAWTHEAEGKKRGLGLLAQLTTLHAGAAQHLAVLLLGHALAALLNDGTHGVLTFV